jgi:outer membrane protein OmpA-like peptidoglycan-associated protein
LHFESILMGDSIAIHPFIDTQPTTIRQIIVQNEHERMKKITYCLIIISLIGNNLSAQKTIEKKDIEKTDTTQKIVREISPSTNFTHWSGGVHVGGSYFRSGPGIYSKYIYGGPIHPINISGLFLEYTANPLFGVGAEYSYIGYGRDYDLGGLGSKTGTFLGETQDAIIFMSTNLANLFNPQRPLYNRVFNTYFDFGVGLGFYNYKFEQAPNAAYTGVSPMSKMGFRFEYSISRKTSLNFEAQYRFYDRSDLGGNTYTTHCDALAVTFGIRRKFAATGAKRHVRNITLREYYPKQAPEKDTTLYQKMQTIQDKNIAYQQEVNSKLKELIQENEELKTRMEKMREDAKAQIQNVEQNTIATNETQALKTKLEKLEADLKALSLKEGEAKVNASFDNIEFETGSNKIQNKSLATLDQIATILKANATWTKLNVYGHTDNKGKPATNEKLSLSRANAVKNYLTSKGLDINIYTAGFGQSKPLAPNTTATGRKKNRRVEFEITK